MILSTTNKNFHSQRKVHNDDDKPYHRFSLLLLLSLQHAVVVMDCIELHFKWNL
jgi:hypothetical protein